MIKMKKVLKNFFILKKENLKLFLMDGKMINGWQKWSLVRQVVQYFTSLHMRNFV